MANLFVNEGTLFPVEGNRPVLLTDPGFVWFVESGKLSVFSVPVEDNSPAGSRHFLFEAGAGDLLFGIDAGGGDEKIGLLASGLAGTRLVQITLERFYELVSRDGGEEILSRVNLWLKALPWEQDRDNPPEALLAASGEERLLVNNVTEDGSAVTLSQFHCTALSSAVSLRQSREQEDTEHIQIRVEHNRALMESAIVRLASVTQKEMKKEYTEVSGDLLYEACLLVGRVLNMKIAPLPPALKGSPSRDPLGDIARVSRFRTRQVALKGEWWNKDSGPLLAYMEEDGRPVALLPLSPSRYELNDLSNKVRIPVNFQVACTIKPFAVSFYRPFPDKKITIKNLLLFAIESTWKRDLAMIFLMGLLGGLLGMVVPIATGIVFDTVIP
ncbi:MAG: NHLP bacteriocin export ABC transporter permease/ATPase subunit, partial [Desulfocucumaceae bacterium]